MFRRKEAVDIEGEVCPYCEFVNVVGSATCAQCYYELNKAPRDQGDPVSNEVSNSIFDELMSDEDDSWEEVDALDVVLTMDQAPVDVDQYSVTDFESEEPEKVGYVESSSPELHNTVAHEPLDVTADDMGEAIQGVEKIEFAKEDPFAQIPEPVHQGRGAVFSPSTPSAMDDDLKGHIGGSELPSLPSDDLYENKINLNAVKAPPPTPAVVLPSIPDIPKTAVIQSAQPVVTPQAEAVASPEIQPAVEEPVTNTPVPTEPTPDIEPEPETVTEPEVAEVVFPPIEQRIWPWPSGEAWDARQVHREVVTALEQTKSGQIDAAKATIDTLGPHLTDENIDLIYHIGMVLKQIDRVEDAKSMLERAKIMMPDNQHVSSAVAYLGV